MALGVRHYLISRESCNIISRPVLPAKCPFLTLPLLYSPSDAEPSGYCKDSFPTRKLSLTERWQMETHRGPKAFLSGSAPISGDSSEIGGSGGREPSTSRTCGQRVWGPPIAARIAIKHVGSNMQRALLSTLSQGKLPSIKLILDSSYALVPDRSVRYRSRGAMCRVKGIRRTINHVGMATYLHRSNPGPTQPAPVGARTDAMWQHHYTADS